MLKINKFCNQFSDKTFWVFVGYICGILKTTVATARPAMDLAIAFTIRLFRSFVRLLCRKIGFFTAPIQANIKQTDCQTPSASAVWRSLFGIHNFAPPPYDRFALSIFIL